LPEWPRFLGSGERVVLQNSCHLVNVEGGGDVPGRLLALVSGDTFVPVAGQDRCCGSAGIYNIQHPDWALRLLDQKMAEVSAETPDRVVVVNPGCQLQMTLGVSRAGLSVPVEHFARYLYRAFRRGQGQSESLH
jgi:glycolate oxidase iron-sulfur subunit